MDKSKYLRLFLDEAKDNIHSYVNELLACEKLGSGDDDHARRTEALDAVFRAAHSIKGMAASMGFDAMAQLAHYLEELADFGRRGETLLVEDYEVLIEGGDVLEDMLHSVADTGVDGGPVALQAEVEKRVRERSNAGDSDADDSPQGETESPSVSPNTSLTTSSGASDAPSGAVVLKMQLDKDGALPAVRGFMAHRVLSGQEGFLSSAPDAAGIKNGQMDDFGVFFHFAKGTDAAPLIGLCLQQQGVLSAELVEETSLTAVVQVPEDKRGETSNGSVELDRSVRVRTRMLDDLIDDVGELLLTRSRLRVLANRLEASELHDLVDEMERLTRDLHDRVMGARMTPLTFIAETFPRVVRDLSRQLRKKVHFEMKGTDIELDRAILDELSTPLLHMLRNAMDHAHEGKEKREEAQKDEAMKLSLVASRNRDRVLVELIEDGAGIDIDGVRSRAIDRGLITAKEASELSDRETFALICIPGFSTAAAVTKTSGRGVGMDVVKATLERVGGSLHIDSTLGHGTRFTLDLPLTVAIIRVLVVEAAGQNARSVFAIPVGRVEHAVDINEERLRYSRGKAHLLLRDYLVPLFDLNAELGFTENEDEGFTGTAIIVGVDEHQTAYRVSAVIGQEEVVAKPLGAPLSHLPFLTGATLLADGRSAYILEPTKLHDGAIT
ncbi:MAG: chemotaxis protein CheA [Deltaproteobacteria bacterium]|nr:chemotaxis protein CheA [Deltaproteobacteria bacterium]